MGYKVLIRNGKGYLTEIGGKPLLHKDGSNGIAEFTNSETLYPSMRVFETVDDFSQIMTKLAFTGKATSSSDGTIVSSSDAIFVSDNGNSTWNYLMFDGSSDWRIYKNSTTDPTNIANGYVSDLTNSLTTSSLEPESDNFTSGGIRYASNRAQAAYRSTTKYINFGADASLDNFMTKSAAWSYGFKLVDPWPLDGMGRPMFCRQGGNFFGGGWAISGGSAQEVFFGNPFIGQFDEGTEYNTIPASGFSPGDYVRVRYDGATYVYFHVNGTQYYRANVTSYWENGAASNSQNVVFGYAYGSNDYQGNNNYERAFWVGRISRLWVANGYFVSEDDDGTNFPTNTTHSWLMSETTGITFSANTGSVNGVGSSV